MELHGHRVGNDWFAMWAWRMPLRAARKLVATYSPQAGIIRTVLELEKLMMRPPSARRVTAFWQAKKAPFHVYRKNPVEFGFGHGADQFVGHDACVVHQNIKPVELCEGRIKQSDDVREISNIRLNHHRSAACCLNLIDELFWPLPRCERN